MELLNRRDRTAELYLAGRTQVVIARELGVSVGTICKDLAWVRSQWLARAVRNMDEIKAEQLARIDWIEQQATEAWFQSTRGQDGGVVTGTGTEAEADVTATAPELPVLAQTAPRRGQCGNDKYLARIGWCVEQRLKVFGLYAPTKVAPTDPTGNRAYSLDVVVRGLSDAQLQALQEANEQFQNHRIAT